MEGDVAHLSDFTGAPLARTTGAAVPCPQEGTGRAELSAAAHTVTALYRSHALGMTRLAFLMRFRATGAPLPARAGYRKLQDALLTANYLAW